MWQQNRILRRQNEIFAREEGVELAAESAGFKQRGHYSNDDRDDQLGTHLGTSGPREYPYLQAVSSFALPL